MAERPAGAVAQQQRVVRRPAGPDAGQLGARIELAHLDMNACIDRLDEIQRIVDGLEEHRIERGEAREQMASECLEEVRSRRVRSLAQGAEERGHFREVIAADGGVDAARGRRRHPDDGIDGLIAVLQLDEVQELREYDAFHPLFPARSAAVSGIFAVISKRSGREI